jgi:Family of unknown function (DUF5681)
MNSSDAGKVPRHPDVGYGRPPRHSRWQPGQCGNPKRKRIRLPARADVIIDSLFAKRFKVVRDGEPQTVTGYEAILIQLLAKETAGHRQAMKVRFKYMEIAQSPEGARPILLRSYGPQQRADEGHEDGGIGMGDL